MATQRKDPQAPVSETPAEGQSNIKKVDENAREFKIQPGVAPWKAKADQPASTGTRRIDH